MKTITRVLGVYFLIFAASASIVYGQTDISGANTADAMLDISATVPLTATISITDLNFGSVLPGSSPSIGATSGDNGLVKIVTNGDASHSISITWTSVTSLASDASLTSSSHSLDFNADIKGGTEPDGAGAVTLSDGDLIFLSTTGDFYIFVGGTLGNNGAVPAEQAPGVYSGSITFTISEN